MIESHTVDVSVQTLASLPESMSSLRPFRALLGNEIFLCEIIGSKYDLSIIVLSIIVLSTFVMNYQLLCFFRFCCLLLAFRTFKDIRRSTVS